MNLEIVVAFLAGITFLLFLLLIIQSKRMDLLVKRMDLQREIYLSIDRSLLVHEDLLKIMLYGLPAQEEELEEDENEIEDEEVEKILLN